ncbi:MFS transporter [Paraburkholderia phenazinium]|jgi:MFS family permease|nr:MFS transporter [Paraburkholderia phenazinium]
MDTQVDPPPEASASSRTQADSVFKYRAFLLFWVARICLALAVRAESVTLGWQVYNVARATKSVEQSAFLVGMVGLSQFVPLFMLTLLAGTVADRCDRRAILQICTVVEIGCALVFAVSRSMLVSLIALIASGAADMISVYVRLTLVQIVTPDAMRGRVPAAAGLFIGGSAGRHTRVSGAICGVLGPL